MKVYGVALICCGVAWSAIACALANVRDSWGISLAAGVPTAFVVGAAVRCPIRTWRGWRWFVLPVLTVGLGSSVFGGLYTAGLWLRATIAGSFEVSPLAIVVSPAFYAYMALTFFVWITYPAALITQYLLRPYARAA